MRRNRKHGMKYQRMMILLMVWLLVGAPHVYGEGETTEEKEDITQEDLEIIRNLELLEMLDVLDEDIDLLENYEIINDLKE